MVVVVPSRHFGGERGAPILLDAEGQSLRAAEHWRRQWVAGEGDTVAS